MIDGGVASHPSLAGKSIEQNGFAGSPQPTGHGTAIASLLVGRQGPFAAPRPARGCSSRTSMAAAGPRARRQHRRALGWLSGHHPQVINISLVGPPNLLVQRAVQIVQSRGIQVVAAVGNDGPAAPPQYPASYPGVVAVTAVDAGGRALPEAGKPTHLDFAAPGADMAAALPAVDIFASAVPASQRRSPLRACSPPDRARGSPPKRVRAKAGSAAAIVCGGCRIDPRSVGAR